MIKSKIFGWDKEKLDQLSDAHLFHLTCRGVLKAWVYGIEPDFDAFQRIPDDVFTPGINMLMIWQQKESAEKSGIKFKKKYTIDNIETYISDMLKSGLFLDITDSHGVPPVGYTAYSYDIQILKQLLEYGARTDWIDYIGRTPIHLIVLFRESEIIEALGLLFAYGAEKMINQLDKQGKTALDYAVKKNLEAENKFLIQHGAKESKALLQEVSETFTEIA